MRKSIVLMILIAWGLAACSTTSSTVSSVPETGSTTETASGSEEGTAMTVSMEPMSGETDVEPEMAADTADVFNSPTAGFTVVKPGSWTFLSAQVVAENREKVDLEDDQLEEMIRKNANAPLVAMAKYPEPYEDLNPSVQVMVRPLGPLADIPPAELLKATVVQLESAFSDFTLTEPISDVEVDGVKAAHMKVAYTVANNEGRKFPTQTLFWMVPRGQYVFTIGMSGPQEGPDVSDEDFNAILETIRFAK